MRFELFGGGKIGRMNPLGDSHAYRDFIEYIKDADRLGYESLFVVEHHFTGVGQLSASLNLLTYLAAVTKRIRLGSAVADQVSAEEDPGHDRLSGRDYQDH